MKLPVFIPNCLDKSHGVHLHLGLHSRVVGRGRLQLCFKPGPEFEFPSSIVSNAERWLNWSTIPKDVTRQGGPLGPLVFWGGSFQGLPMYQQRLVNSPSGDSAGDGVATLGPALAGVSPKSTRHGAVFK